jgi:hypothetical protein
MTSTLPQVMTQFGSTLTPLLTNNGSNNVFEAKQFPSDTLFEEDGEDSAQKPNAMINKFFRFIPAILFFGTVLLCVYWSLMNTFLYFFFTCVFCAYQTYFTGYMSYYAYHGVNNIYNALKKDWHREYMLKLKRNKENTHFLNWDDVTHYVIVPNYNENMSVLCETLGAIAQSSLSRSHIIPVLAMEEREQGGEDKARQLIQRFQNNFKGILISIHPPNMPGETPGKSSNENWAFKHSVVPDVRKRQLRTENVCVSICDADSVHHQKHFEALNFKFCTDPHRHTRIYQAPMINFLNVDTVPAPTRLMSAAVTMHEIAHVTNYKRNEVLPFSTYSMSFNCARDVGGWDGDYIAEDWHNFLKCYFSTGGKMRVEALPYPVMCYAVESETYWKSLKDRWEQAKRHALALIEIPYFLNRVVGSFKTTSRPNLIRTLALFYKITWPHYIATAHLFLLLYTPFVLFLYSSSWAPYWIADDEKMTVNTVWGLVFQIISALCFITGPVGMVINTHRVAILAKGQEMNKWWRIPQYLLEWIFIVTPANFFFATIPTFMAATKMIYKQEFKYVCASKPEALTPMTPLVDLESHFEVIVDGEQEE